MHTIQQTTCHRYAVSLRSTAGATWAKERARIEVDACDDCTAVVCAKEVAQARFKDERAWYAEQVEEIA